MRDEEALQQLNQQNLFENAIVTTILEAKGMEYEEVVLWNFFSSSGLKHRDWLLCYQVLVENNTDPGVLSEIRFDHSELASEFKKFYVAVTRARTSLVLFEENFGFKKLILPLFGDAVSQSIAEFKTAEVRRKLCDFDPTEQSETGWIVRGAELFQKQNYEMAIKCFRNANRKTLTETVVAHQLAHQAAVRANSEH